MNWYYIRGKDQVGPISEEQFRELVGSGVITPETHVWRDGMPDWQRHKNVQIPDAGVAVMEGGRKCVECGNLFPPDELLRFGDSFVCASCKPVFLQRKREGAPLAGVLNYGGFWIRAGAKIVDYVILYVVGAIVQVIGYGVLWPVMNAEENTEPIYLLMSGVLTIIQIAIAATYTTWFLGKFAATPGKMVCRLKVVTSDGGQVSYSRAFGRHFAEMLSGCILFIGYIMAAFDGQKRTLHDHICDTRVVYK